MGDFNDVFARLRRTRPEPVDHGTRGGDGQTVRPGDVILIVRFIGQYVCIKTVRV